MASKKWFDQRTNISFWKKKKKGQYLTGKEASFVLDHLLTLLRQMREGKYDEYVKTTEGKMMNQCLNQLIIYEESEEKYERISL